MCKNTYINIQTGEELDLNRVNELKPNAMLKVNPTLFNEWDFEKNNELGLDVYKVTKGMKIKARWICISNKNHKWEASIANRSKNDGTSCPYCIGRIPKSINSLALLNPELAKEWHPTKNGNLTPYDVSCSKAIKVWWLGKCGHEWDSAINTRSKGHGCPYCANQKILKGFNDMWTTNPELASLLANPEDGYRYSQNSTKNVNWKCPDCKTFIENKVIVNINRNGLSCPSCSDKMSFAEKMMYNILKELKVGFIKEKSFIWSDNKRYDFYIPKHNTIIEVHGSQHYGDSFESVGGRTFEEEIKNDKIKKEMAFKQGIHNYIELNCSKNTLDYIRNSILNSELTHILELNDLQWEELAKKSSKSILFEILDLWNNGTSILKISNNIGLSTTSITKYIDKGFNLRLTKKERSMKGEKNCFLKRKIIQLDLNYNKIKQWSSISNASEFLKIHASAVSKVCKGHRKTSGGYIWMYKEDYDKYIEEQKQLA